MTRLALIADIHGHDVALEAVLTDLQPYRVDAILCLGDVATIGPQPKQLLARLQATGCLCILGNHDAALLSPEHALAYQVAAPLLPTLHWCAAQLDQSDLDYLRSFKHSVTFPLGPDVNLLAFHGSPRSYTDLILPTISEEELEHLLADQTATILAGGHSHIQMMRQHRGKVVVNPGSVGSVFLRPPLANTTPTLLPWAEYALLTWINGVLSVELRRVPFDLKLFFEVVAESTIPIKSWWQQQYQQVYY